MLHVVINFVGLGEVTLSIKEKDEQEKDYNVCLECK